MNTVKRIVAVALTSLAAAFALSPIMGDLRPPKYGNIAVGAYLMGVAIYLFVIYLLSIRPQTYVSTNWKKVVKISLLTGIVFGAVYIVVYVKWTENGQLFPKYDEPACLWIETKKELDGVPPSRAEVERAFPLPYVEGSKDDRALAMIFIYIATLSGFCATVFALCELIEAHSSASRPTKEPNAYSPIPTTQAKTQKEKKVEKLRTFIVHGHDTKSKLSLKDYLQNTLSFPEPVILHQQPNKGRTVIEKFEDCSGAIDVAFILLTPDDVGGASEGEQKERARQNVIFELGFFVGKYGRKSGRIILLHKGDLEIPSDLAGVVYINISNGIESAGEEIRRELQGLSLV
jgi:predicted nucleotide-binding protein